MNTIEGLVLISGLSLFCLFTFIVCYYADRFHNRIIRDRQMLLQRVQAPVQAVDQHVVQQAQEQPRMTPRYDDDEELNTLLAGDMIGFDPLGDQ